MMQRINKEFIKHTFAHTWYLYPIIALIIVVAFIWGFGMFHQPSDHQRLTIFIGANEIENSSLDSKLKKEFSEDDLRIVEIHYVSPSHPQYANKLNLMLSNADFLILPDSTLVEFKDYYDGFFYELNDYAKSYFNKPHEYIKDKELDYGIIAKKANQEMLLDKYCYFEKNMNYSLLFSLSSKNVGKLKSESEAKYDNALKAASYLLEREL